MTKIAAERLELFVNDYLKEDLKRLERFVDHFNEEIMEFIQLKNTVQTMREHLGGRFKTQMNIGGSTFMEAEVDCAEKIIINVGKSCFVEFTLDEAIKFVNFKVAVLTKECQVFRDESIKKRSDIKLALLYMAETQK